PRSTWSASTASWGSSPTARRTTRTGSRTSRCCAGGRGSLARAKAKSAREAAAGGRWLLKTEPSVYGWDRMTADRRTAWDGVRNHQARNHLAAMKKGDQALYYHTDEERSAVGVVEVV